MKIGIIGRGFVGNAVANAFLCDKFIVDPKFSSHTIQDLIDWSADLVFICLPTPSNENGSVNGDLIRDTLEALPNHLTKVVKSTVMPEYLEGFENVVYNPEFLTQRTAAQDFLNPDTLIFGGDRKNCEYVNFVYRKHSKVKLCNPIYTDIKTACLVKYTLNSFFATKVIFMNEIQKLHESIGGRDWEEFTSILGEDPRMTPNHLQVPGPDGLYGYGGACFPKDTKALVYLADSVGVDLSVLKQAMERNGEVRNG